MSRREKKKYNPCEERGIYFGYPACCIRWFVDNRYKAESPADCPPLTAKQEEVTNGYTGFIPCPSCAEKVTAETLYILINNRQCPTAFPLESQP